MSTPELTRLYAERYEIRDALAAVELNIDALHVTRDTLANRLNQLNNDIAVQNVLRALPVRMAIEEDVGDRAVNRAEVIELRFSKNGTALQRDEATPPTAA